MAPSPHLLAERAWDAGAARFEVAVLPWGATEAHNRHLPYGTDTLATEAVAAAAAALASERGARVLVLPPVPFGVQTGQREIPFCLNLNPGTQAAVLADLLPALADHGVRKLVILNGHGGNDFRQIIRELVPRTPLFLCQVSWYACVPAARFFDQPGDHAGELETSVMLHLRPDLVRPLSEAGTGAARSFRVAGLREGWAWAPRHWVAVTDDTGVGDPARASAEKGARFLNAVTERLAGFLAELAEADPAALYQ